MRYLRDENLVRIRDKDEGHRQSFKPPTWTTPLEEFKKCKRPQKAASVALVCVATVYLVLGGL